ncbi:MAG TPA: hypothetical protein VMP03_05635 [Methylomirabilota bacterium]|nr:hypothetical protein [Methylomirabilota bacterium]
MRLLIAAATALVIGGGAANAACTVEDLEGRWTMNQTNRSEICAVRIADDGKIEGTCRTYKKTKVTTTKSVQGAIDITNRCTVDGRLKVGDTTRSFGGKADADMSMITGVIFRHSGFLAYRNN